MICCWELIKKVTLVRQIPDAPLTEASSASIGLSDLETGKYSLLDQIPSEKGSSRWNLMRRIEELMVGRIS